MLIQAPELKQYCVFWAELVIGIEYVMGTSSVFNFFVLQEIVIIKPQ